MAADENNEVQQVIDSSSSKKTFELSSPLKNDFTFLCNGLDSFLESLKLDSESKGPEARSVSGACATRTDPEEPDRPGVPPLPLNRPSTSVTPTSKSSNTEVLLKDYDCPKPIILFNRAIPVSSTHKFTRSIRFTQQRPSQSIDCIAECRFPPKLRSLYKGLDRLENKKQPDVAGEQESTPVKTRRRRQRNRLSLSDHAFDNDDAHSRRNLLPTEDDLRTTYDKIYNFRGIRYIFGCSRGESCESPTKCARDASSFSLFMEINPKPGTPLHPLVRENINCVLGDSCVVDKLSASVAVSALKCQNAPLNRLFIPVSYHLKDKIGFVDGIAPEVFPETKIEEPVRGVVDDLLDFVDRQMGFVDKFEYDPDLLSSAENSFSGGGSQEDDDCLKINSEVLYHERQISERRRRRGKCKEQNKVLRELKKLMNISVTDEAAEVVENSDYKCSEPSCSLGCVCSSVHEKCHPPPEHCNNIGCMFECICPDQSREMYLNLGDLSKEEKSWHQTVIRKRNNALEIKSGVDRSKRRKKMPSRYENTVTGYMMNRCLELNLREKRKSTELKELRASSLTKSTRSVTSDNQKVQCTPNRSSKSVKDVADLDEETTQRNAAIAEKIRKSLRDKYQNKLLVHNERRLSLTVNEEANSLYDTFVWCTVHHKYDCYCINWIIFGKENNLVCKPPSFNRFTAEKFLGSVILEKSEGDPRKVVCYDQDKHCVRTAGPYIDYGNRNKDAMFKKKLLYLLEHKIVSFSNSYVKAKPVATFITENPSDNYPYVPASVRKITQGVGDVVNITLKSILNEPVDVGDHLVTSLQNQLYIPPDNLMWESSDEELVDNSDFLLDSEGSEFIPKPQSKILSSKQRFCFSSVLKNNAKCTPKEEDSTCDQNNYDSDVELVEEPIETYSVASSPEPEVVDGGTLSDSSSDDDGRSQANGTISVNGKKCESSERENGRVSPDSKYSIPDDSDSFSSPTKLVIDESVDTSQSPAKSPGEEVDPQNPESDKIQITVEKVEYPQKGLFCMSLPDLGYLKVVDSRQNNFTMEDPCNPLALKTFQNCKEANDFMKVLVGVHINVAFATSDWVMVTRGVLEKYKSKPFDLSSLRQKKRKRENNQSQNKSKIVRPNNEKILRAQFDLKVPQDMSHMGGKQCDIFQSSHHLLTNSADRVRTTPGNIKPVVSVPTTSQTVTVPTTSQTVIVPTTKNLVGTFPNINEANSFIEKNYQSRVYVRPSTASSTTQTTGTILTAGTNQISGKFVRLPLLSGPRVRGGVPPNKSIRTVLVRGTIARQPITRPVIHIRPTFTVSGGVAQTPTVGSVVSTTNAGVSKTQVDTTASSSNSMTLYGTPASDNGTETRGCSSTSSLTSIFPNQFTTPLTSFPVRACPKGTIIVSATSSAAKLKQAESSASVPFAFSGTSSSPSVNQVLQSTAPTSNSRPSNPVAFKMVAAPVNVVDNTASSLGTPAKQVVSNEDTTADGPLPELTSDPPKTPDPRKVPGTFIIESFTTSSSTSASSPTAIVVRHARPILPKLVIPKVPPRRADVIVPRDDEFATLISPAPSDTPPAAKVAATPEKVFNGVLLPKSDKKEIKAYICRKKPASKSNYRSLLPKR